MPSSAKLILNENDAWKSGFFTGANKQVLIQQMVGSAAGTLAAGDDARFEKPFLWLTKTAAYTAATKDRILADTSSLDFSIEAIADPSVGDSFIVQDAKGTFATNNLTIGRNGNLIAGLDEDLILDVNGVKVTLVFAGGDVGWVYTVEQTSVGYLTIDSEARNALKSVVTDIANGVESVNVVFPGIAFEDTPSVTFAVEKASGSDPDLLVVGVSALTNLGCTVHLSAAAPAGTYKLHTQAVKR